jgi:hypothetical protein
MATTDKLTEAQVKNTKPTDAPYKLSDGGGRYPMPITYSISRAKCARYWLAIIQGKSLFTRIVIPIKSSLALYLRFFEGHIGQTIKAFDFL